MIFQQRRRPLQSAMSFRILSNLTDQNMFRSVENESLQTFYYYQAIISLKCTIHTEMDCKTQNMFAIHIQREIGLYLHCMGMESRWYWPLEVTTSNLCKRHNSPYLNCHPYSRPAQLINRLHRQLHRFQQTLHMTVQPFLHLLGHVWNARDHQCF